MRLNSLCSFAPATTRVIARPAYRLGRHDLALQVGGLQGALPGTITPAFLPCSSRVEGLEVLDIVASAGPSRDYWQGAVTDPSAVDQEPEVHARSLELHTRPDRENVLLAHRAMAHLDYVAQWRISEVPHHGHLLPRTAPRPCQDGECSFV